MSDVTVDCLKADGKQPVASEMSMMFVIMGASTDEHCLSREVGIGSRSHCLFSDE